MDKIIIRDLLLRSIIGVTEAERKDRQDILINLTLFTDTRAAGASDDIADAVNYRTVTKRVIKHVEESADFLVEKLANDIARLLLTEFDLSRAIVRVEKPGALRFTASVGVEIDRSRADYAAKRDGE